MLKQNIRVFIGSAGIVMMMCTLLSAAGCGGGGSLGEPAARSSSDISIKANQTIPNHPHTIDYFVPNNATATVIFLHGGGGTKEGLEYSLGIKADNSTRDYYLSNSGQSWLMSERVMAVFPQGQTAAAAN
jgi:hypothetical protein